MKRKVNTLKQSLATVWLKPKMVVVAVNTPCVSGQHMTVHRDVQ